MTEGRTSGGAPELSYQCEARPGTYSLKTDAASGRVNVSGRVRLIELHEHERWAPSASVFVRGDEDWKQTGLTVSVYPQSPDTLQILAVSPGVPLGRSVFARFPKTNVPMRFELAFTPAGTLSLKVAEESTTEGIIPFEAEDVAVGCSSGEFEFTDVHTSAGT